MIIFDWDGTLCDSVAQIVVAVQQAATGMGLEAPSDAAAANIIGLGLREALARLYPDIPEEELVAMIKAYSATYVANEEAPPQLFPGALDTLQALRDSGYALGVATGKSRRGLDRVLARLGMEEFFEITRCADETRSKPHPQMLQEIMAVQQVAPHEVIMVGDTEYDLEMAANAGVASVGVSFGVHSVSRLQKHGPLAVVDSLPELIAVIGAR
ncbi:HAD family hydrolase [Halioglobus japonicus]|uniref:HAD family hydrolase n=1 Tax=Halioglobus japonicus TaxID=930805 RepID=A0AAP8MG81_9GAMM|nr:HAD-IA family hydrolase [Halioglobus japonicus]AQA18808.1 HAD family hydrolase [Halioglobus japonicus]PLW86839.1 HAD family hydrolase [Halioglobus japonicus]GHD23783.1 hydrolase [Halioglobus japonicus]